MKHAYLITAYRNFHNLEKLIRLLDDERNDIYIHIDRKTKGFDFARFGRLPAKSRIYFTRRVKHYWGGFSQVKAILILLRAATGKGYRYYHRVSGCSLPIKSQDEIHAFFERNDGKEFVHFSGSWGSDRVAKYWLFSNASRRKGLLGKAGRLANEWFAAAQNRLHYNRLTRHSEPVKMGADWFSITHALAVFVLANKRKIGFFRHSLNASEHFLQTLVFNSPFYERLNSRIEYDPRSYMRLIEWRRRSVDRMSPRTFTAEDFESIMGSEMLFARKFDEDVDRAIIDRVFQAVYERQRGPGQHGATGVEQPAVPKLRP